MKTNETVAPLIENLVEYCKVYTKAYLALVEAGLPPDIALTEARVLGLMAVTPTDAPSIIHSFGEKVGEA